MYAYRHCDFMTTLYIAFLIIPIKEAYTINIISCVHFERNKLKYYLFAPSYIIFVWLIRSARQTSFEPVEITEISRKRHRFLRSYKRWYGMFEISKTYSVRTILFEKQISLTCRTNTIRIFKHANKTLFSSSFY